MAVNQFVAKNGLISKNDADVSGSLHVTNNVSIGFTSITNSLDVNGNIYCNIITASLNGNANTSTSSSISTTSSYILGSNVNGSVFSAITSYYASSSMYVSASNVYGPVLSSISSSYASGSTSSSYSLSSSFSRNSLTASYIGSGTDNYIPKWSSNTLTSTSNVYDNGTTVLIGSNTITGITPRGTLSLINVGTSTSESISMSLFAGNDSQQKAVAATRIIGGYKDFTTWASSYLRIQSHVGNTNAFTDTINITNGRMGIMTNDPQVQLHVNGTISASNIIAPLQGTSSWSLRSVSASYATTCSYYSYYNVTQSLSYITSASYASSSTSSSYSLYSNSSSYALSASYSLINPTFSSSISTIKQNTLTPDQIYNITSSIAMTASYIGSGTNGYLPKWNNNLLTTSSSIYDTGTNAGINTTTPNTRFEISESGTINGNTDILTLKSGLTGANSVSAGVGIRFSQNSDGTKAGIQFNEHNGNNGSQIRFLTQQSNPSGLRNVMCVDENARVGIGTTASVNTLDVIGNISASVITASVFAPYVKGTDSTIVVKTNTNNGLAISNDYVYPSKATYDIGTTSNKFQNGYFSGFVYGGDVAISSDSTYGYLQSYNSKPLKINDLGNNILFTGTGNIIFSGSNKIGIDTNTPSVKLHLVGRQYIQLDDTSVAPTQLTILGNANTNQQLLIGYNTTNDYASIQSIKQGTAFEPLYLNVNGGNVSIGTTTSVNRLEVNGNIRCNVITASLLGTSSYSTTSSYILPQNIANNYSASVSYLLNLKQDALITNQLYSISSSYSIQSLSASYSLTSSYSNYANNGDVSWFRYISNVSGAYQQIDGFGVTSNKIVAGSYGVKFNLPRPNENYALTYEGINESNLPCIASFLNRTTTNFTMSVYPISNPASTTDISSGSITVVQFY